MKKFKSILALTASVLALSAFAAPVSAFASDAKDTYDGQAWNTDSDISLTKTYNPTYLVTIPANVSFDSANTVTDTVTVTNIYLESNKAVTVSATCSGTLKLGGTDATNTVAYSAKHANTTEGAASGTAITESTSIVTATSSDNGNNVTEYIAFSLTDTAPAIAGTYSDTMTFTVNYQ